jgi:hypothetical protein
MHPLLVYLSVTARTHSSFLSFHRHYGFVFAGNDPLAALPLPLFPPSIGIIIPAIKQLLGETKADLVEAAGQVLHKATFLVDNRDILPLLPALCAVLTRSKQCLSFQQR